SAVSSQLSALSGQLKTDPYAMVSRPIYEHVEGACARRRRGRSSGRAADAGADTEPPIDWRPRVRARRIATRVHRRRAAEGRDAAAPSLDARRGERARPAAHDGRRQERLVAAMVAR